MRERGLKFLNFALRFILFSLIGLSPIFFQCYTYRCWEINQIFLLQVLVELATLFWIIKILFFKSFFIQKKFIIPPLLFIFSLFLSTILSDSFSYSFFGSLTRKMGFVTWLHLFLFFLIFISEIDLKKDLKKILIIILISLTIVCLYGILQFLGIDFIRWSEPAYLTYRIFSTFGQPNFLGSFLVLVIPLVFFSFFYFKNFYFRSFILFLLFLSILSLILTLSRGAWLGFFTELIFFTYFILFLKRKRKLIFFFSFLFLFLIIFWLILNIKVDFTFNFKSPILKRFESLIFLKKAVTGFTRLSTWQIALDLISKRPFFGYGPEMLSFYSMKYYQPVFAVYEAINTYFDRAHNDILDTLLVSGIFGLITYLIFLFSIFYFGFKEIKKQRKISKNFALFVLTGIIGYLVSLQFSFHVIQTLLYFWLFSSLIYLISIRKKEIKRSLKIDFKKIILFILVLFAICFSIFEFNVKMILADYYYKKALIALLNNNFGDFLEYFYKVFELKPDEVTYREKFAMYLVDLAISLNNEKEKLRILDLAIETIDEIDSSILPFEARLFKVKAYILKANLTKKEEDFKIANQAIKNLVEFSPKWAYGYSEWCQLKIYEKDFKEAEELCQKALSLYPDLNHPLLNLEHRQLIVNEMVKVYEKLGQIYFETKNYDLALEVYFKLLHLDPFQYHIYKKIADIYYLRKDLDTAIKYNLHGFTLNPKDDTWPYVIGLLYQEKKDLKTAEKYFKLASEIKKRK